MNVNKYTKAIATFFGTGFAAYQVANADKVVTGHEWQDVLIGAVVAAVLVWAVPNAQDKAPVEPYSSQSLSVSEPGPALTVED